MATVELPGIQSGIDTAALVQQLMTVESRSLNTYQSRMTEWQSKQTALNELESKLSALRSAAKALSNSEELQAYNVSSSDTDKVTAEASYNAFEGNHTIIVEQLANAEKWVHNTGVEYIEDYVGAGTFIYSYNNRETTITTTATTTLEDFVGMINNDANNPGVSAGLLYYNDKYHLVLNGTDAGTDFEISINASNTEVWKTDSPILANSDNASLTTKIIELDGFSGTLVGDDKIVISGTDNTGAAISPDLELTVTENTKITHLIDQINAHFDGVATAYFENGQIVLTSDTAGTSSLSISLSFVQGTGGDAALTLPTMSQDTVGGTTAASLTGFADTDFTETQAAQDSKIKVDGFPTGGTEWITRSSNTIDDVISGITLHLHDTTDLVNGEEITLTRDIESLKEKINTLATAYNEAVHFIQENTAYEKAEGEEKGKAGILIGDFIVSTIKSQIRNPLFAITSGFTDTYDSMLMPGHIGLELDKEGLLNFDTKVFDEAVSNDYVGVLELIGANKIGSNDGDSQIEFYGANSNYTKGGTYEVEVEVNSSNEITSAKIRLEGQTEWRNATWEGNTVTGMTDFNDDGDPLYPEWGLQFTVDLSASGTYDSTIRVKQGFAGAVEDEIDKMLRYEIGTLTLSKQQSKDNIEALQDKIELEQYRLDNKKSRLSARFARLERDMALLQNQSAALSLG